MRISVLVLLLLALAGLAYADPPPMAAAGVLERNGRPDCSAVLITPEVIATAAHCIAGKKLADEGGEDRVLFRTGAYPGHPAREFEVARIATHPLYAARAVVPGRGIGADLALGRLARAVPAEIAAPVPLGAPIEADASVLIATWPGGAGQRARERRCPVLSAEPKLATLSCVVVPGESGGAVVRLTPEGPELAAVVVATARKGHQPYGFAVQAESRIRQLQAIHGF